MPGHPARNLERFFGRICWGPHQILKSRNGGAAHAHVTRAGYQLRLMILGISGLRWDMAHFSAVDRYVDRHLNWKHVSGLQTRFKREVGDYFGGWSFDWPTTRCWFGIWNHTYDVQSGFCRAIIEGKMKWYNRNYVMILASRICRYMAR